MKSQLLALKNKVNLYTGLTYTPENTVWLLFTPHPHPHHTSNNQKASLYETQGYFHTIAQANTTVILWIKIENFANFLQFNHGNTDGWFNDQDI